jgi:cytochrome c
MKAFIMAAASIAVSAATARAQDIEKGQHSFSKCLPCHSIGEDAQSKIGPELNGLDGRRSGSVADYTYSDATRTQASGGTSPPSSSTSKTPKPCSRAPK